jgi:inhibitor of cysteine peptidase
LGTYTGTKSDLTGASFVVFHSIYVDYYSPPAGTDLVNWVKENYSYYEDIPDEINMEIDGIPALRVYTPKSPMAWSQEDIYFIRNDKVFQINMLDVDNKDNKELYTKMLFTFRFIEILKEETIGVVMDDNFSISLEANPTTGYEWEVEFDSDYLELVNKEYIPDSDESLVGAGGHRIFNFLALKSGNTSIKFSYLRPWEGNAIKIQVYEIIIE